jgi:sterol desaturase/sphingolipid hydroxylase (fatty acid hydroxylase superfamily)
MSQTPSKPEEDFHEAIELAKLQAKISSQQADAYAFVSLAFTLAIAFLVVLYNPSIWGYLGWELTATIFGIIPIVVIVTAFFRLYVLHRFYSAEVKSDFNKIEHKQKITL